MAEVTSDVLGRPMAQAAATPGPTDFRTWCEQVLRPAALA
jgi:hypothetical protein